MRADQLIDWLSRGGTALLLGLTTAMTTMTSCTPHGQCNGMDYFVYTANSSSPKLFHEDRGRARFFAHPPDAGSVLYQYDGASPEALGSLADEPLARASLQGTPVVLTRGGLWRLTASDGFEVLKRFDAPLPDAQCGPRTDLLVELGGQLVFVGPDAAGDGQLWVYHPTTDTIEIMEVPWQSPGSGPQSSCGPSSQLPRFAGLQGCGGPTGFVVKGAVDVDPRRAGSPGGAQRQRAGRRM